MSPYAYSFSAPLESHLAGDDVPFEPPKSWTV